MWSRRLVVGRVATGTTRQKTPSETRLNGMVWQKKDGMVWYVMAWYAWYASHQHAKTMVCYVAQNLGASSWTSSAPVRPVPPRVHRRPQGSNSWLHCAPELCGDSGSTWRRHAVCGTRALPRGVSPAVVSAVPPVFFSVENQVKKGPPFRKQQNVANIDVTVKWLVVST